MSHPTDPLRNDAKQDGIVFSESRHAALVRQARDANVTFDPPSTRSRTPLFVAAILIATVGVGWLTLHQRTTQIDRANSVASGLAVPLSVTSVAMDRASLPPLDGSLVETLDQGTRDVIDFLRDRASDARTLAVKPG